MQLNKKQRQLSITVITSLAIISATTILFKTYPHLNPFSKKDSKDEESKEEPKGESMEELKDELKESTEPIV